MSAPTGARTLEYAALTITATDSTRAALVARGATVTIVCSGIDIKTVLIPKAASFRIPLSYPLIDGDEIMMRVCTPPGAAPAIAESAIQLTAELCITGQTEANTDFDLAKLGECIEGKHPGGETAALVSMTGPRVDFAHRSCVICGCTDARACIGPDGKPCHWVAPFLCSNCAGIAREARARE